MPLVKISTPQVATEAVLRGIVAGVAQGLLGAGIATRDQLRPHKAHELAKRVLVVLRGLNLKDLTAELRVLWRQGPDQYLQQLKREL